MRSLCRTSSTVAALVIFSMTSLAAQDWVGRGRVEGRVQDTKGQPVEGAKITLHKPGKPEEGPPAVTSNRTGRWSYLGIAGGAWTVNVDKEGYQPVSAEFRFEEFGRNPPVNVELAPIPQEVIRARELEEAVAWVEEGNRLLAEGDHAAAREEYERAFPRLEPEHQVAVLRAIARTHFQEGAAKLAEARLRDALEIDPEDREALLLLVTFLVAEGREEEAEELAARLPPGADMDPVTLLNLGIRSFNAGDHEAAHGFFERAIQADPELPDSYYYHGLTAMAQGLLDEARHAFETLLELAPDHEHAPEAREFLEML